MTIFDSQSITALIVAIPSLAVTYVGYRLSRKKDEDSSNANVSSDKLVTMAQVFDRLNKIVDNLQEDNKTLRQEVIDCKNKYQALEQHVSKLEKELYVLKRESQVTK